MSNLMIQIRLVGGPYDGKIHKLSEPADSIQFPRKFRANPQASKIHYLVHFYEPSKQDPTAFIYKGWQADDQEIA